MEWIGMQSYVCEWSSNMNFDSYLMCLATQPVARWACVLPLDQRLGALKWSYVYAPNCLAIFHLQFEIQLDLIIWQRDQTLGDGGGDGGGRDHFKSYICIWPFSWESCAIPSFHSWIFYAPNFTPKSPSTRPTIFHFHWTFHYWLLYIQRRQLFGVA